MYPPSSIFSWMEDGGVASEDPFGIYSKTLKVDAFLYLQWDLRETAKLPKKFTFEAREKTKTKHGGYENRTYRWSACSWHQLEVRQGAPTGCIASSDTRTDEL